MVIFFTGTKLEIKLPIFAYGVNEKKVSVYSLKKINIYNYVNKQTTCVVLLTCAWNITCFHTGVLPTKKLMLW